MRMPAAVMLVCLMPLAKSIRGTEVTAPLRTKKTISEPVREENVVSPENCAYRIKPRARGSTDRVSMQMETSLRARMPFFSAPYRAKLRAMIMARYGTLP